MCASALEAVVDSLARKTIRAARKIGAKTVVVAGGVSANRRLRERLRDDCDKAGLRLSIPPMKLCTDNAAMIGSAAFYRLMRGEIAGLDLNATPSLRLV